MKSADANEKKENKRKNENFDVKGILSDAISIKIDKDIISEKIISPVELMRRTKCLLQGVKVEPNSKKSIYFQIQKFKVLGKNFVTMKKKEEEKKYQKKKIKRERSRFVFEKFSCFDGKDRRGVSNKQKKGFSFYKNLNAKRE